MMYVALGLGVVIAVESLVVVGMALRLSGLRADAKDADQKREAAEAQLMETARELKEYRERTKKQLDDLRGDIEELENDLEKCTTPGARRSRLERLLSKAADD